MDWSFLAKAAASMGSKGGGGAKPSAWSQMDGGQRLSSIGSMLSGGGAQPTLAEIIAQSRGEFAPERDGQAIAAAFGGGPAPMERGPVTNADGADISAAFGSGQGQKRRKFGFGRG